MRRCIEDGYGGCGCWDERALGGETDAGGVWV